MGLLVLAALLTYEPTPPPSRILVLQEAQARLNTRSGAIEQIMVSKPARVHRAMSDEQRQELLAALDRFARERPGQVVDLR